MLDGRTSDEWVAQYAASHQHPVNRFCHTIGIPLIVVSIAMLAVSIWVQVLLVPAIAVFVAGWIFQFVGHAFERKWPEFFHDWRFLFVGLRWWVAKLRGRAVVTAVAVLALSGVALAQAHKPPKPPKSVRLYIFDCGVIHTTNGDAYSLKKDEMASTEMSIPCILVAHPKGTLMWDNGDIPDRAFPPGGGPATAGIVTQDKPLLPQMAAIGYAPSDITYLSMSHYHGDHVANANSFAGATWLVRKVERDRMFSGEPIPRSDRANYSELEHSKTILLEENERDVFGDGTVVIKFTPGHTPGHNVLFVKLKKTGPVVLSGDLYHYSEERTLNRLPPGDFNKEQTAASRAELEIFLKKTGAQLWIEHDIIANARLKKAPAFYE